METVEKPLVSIVMTVRNAEAFISETLASLLQERQIPLEIVLVDNGCTDATVERALAFNDDRIRILAGPRKGIAHALNVAYAAVQGEIIMRCDGDDLFPPQRLVRQAQWLAEHPEFGAMCGGFCTIDSQGKPLAELLQDQTSKEITEELRSGELRTHIGTFAIRTDVVKAAGGSREYFDCFEDYDFQLRVGETCRVWFDPTIEYIYRIHRKSSSHTTSWAKNNFYCSTAFEFQRQRQTQGSDDLQRGCPPAVPDGRKAPFWDAAWHQQKMLMASSWTEHQRGHKKYALKKGIRSVLALPINPTAWRSLIALAIKPVSAQPNRDSNTVSDWSNQPAIVQTPDQANEAENFTQNHPCNQQPNTVNAATLQR